uniref:Uncharacterized protein n=1 Tax=Strongyloides venezuelensis TaxID=75913 RepID=A0A0K0EWS7_STRVS
MEKKSKSFIVSSDGKKEEAKNLTFNDLESPFFDSSDYRCCFNLFHAKIVTFICCTLVLHEIVLGTIYLVGLEEFAKKEWQIIGIFVMRLFQLPPTATAYYSLWRCNPYLIIPFGISQICIGSFADIFTILRVIKDLDEHNSLLLPFTGSFEIFNILIPLVIYILLAISLIWILYRCHIYFIARKMYQTERDMYKSEQKNISKSRKKSIEEVGMLRYK